MAATGVGIGTFQRVKVASGSKSLISRRFCIKLTKTAPPAAEEYRIGEGKDSAGTDMRKRRPKKCRVSVSLPAAGPFSFLKNSLNADKPALTLPKQKGHPKTGVAFLTFFLQKVPRY